MAEIELGVVFNMNLITDAEGKPAVEVEHQDGSKTIHAFDQNGEIEVMARLHHRMRNRLGGHSHQGGDEGGGGGTTPEWLPDGAILHADFDAGHFYANGAVTTLAAMFEADAAKGTWDGATGPSSTNKPVIPLSALASVASTGMTVVIKGNKGTDTSFGVEFYADDGDPDFGFMLGVNNAGIEDYVGGSALAPSGSVEDGEVTQAAATITPTKLAGSNRGQETATIDNFWTPGPFKATFVIGGDAEIQVLTIYAPVPDADLPTLSALPAIPVTHDGVPVTHNGVAVTL